MPGLKENQGDSAQKMEIAGAITYPNTENVSTTTTSNNSTSENSQPRQPTNLQGLLRFAMDATQAEDAPTTESHDLPMDEERRKFLEDALKSMTIDVVEILQKQIRVLQRSEEVKKDGDCSNFLEAFETILDFIDNIDVANDFHKIGGFTIFHPCLKCENPTIRAGACNILAELCQNNPYCQRVVLDNSFMPILLKILDQDDSNEVCVKALYAVSCIIRENTEGFNQFIMYGGLSVLLKCLQKNEDKLRTKTTFLLGALCRNHTDLKSRLVFLEYVPVLIKLIKEPRMPSHEHILSLLVQLVEENQTASVECRKPEHNFKDVLLSHLQMVKNKDECLEEEQYCRRLVRILFSGISTGL